MAPTNAAHRPTGWKQSNKGHNTGRHRSKGAVEKENRGRVEGGAVCGRKKGKVLGKAGRRHKQEQLRRAAQEEMAARKRSVGGQGAPPLLVGVVALAESQAEGAASLVTSLSSCIPGSWQPWWT
jgi:pre-rRNA-processing protein TSR1